MVSFKALFGKSRTRLRSERGANYPEVSAMLAVLIAVGVAGVSAFRGGLSNQITTTAKVHSPGALNWKYDATGNKFEPLQRIEPNRSSAANPSSSGGTANPGGSSSGGTAGNPGGWSTGASSGGGPVIMIGRH